MGERGPESGVDPITGRLNESTMNFATAITAGEYDSEAVTGAFAAVEAAVNEAAEAGIKSPVEVYDALRELSDAVTATAEVHDDELTAKIFKARSMTYAAMVGVLSVEPSSPEVTPPAAAPAAQKRRGGRGKKSDTSKQRLSGAKS